jgi:glycosyltransferase involved in cell wall biosynthesis
MTRLIVAYPGTVSFVTKNTLVLDEKLRVGMSAYRRLWPHGDVCLAAQATEQISREGAGSRTVRLDELDFDLVTGPTWSDAVRRAGRGLLLAPLIGRFAELEHRASDSVLVAEFTPEDLASTERATARGIAPRARVTLGSIRRRRQMDAWVRTARGVQCNGHPAYDRFSPLSASSLLFFDTRLTQEHVRRAEQAARATPHQPPRLCFSGRLIPGKGPQHAIAVANLLRNQGFECRLSVLGVGDLEASLREQAQDHVEFLGVRDFATAWTPFVTNEVDLMLLPHVQGDPSGTYLEAAGCGVPIVGFDNVALASLSRHHQVGQTAPVGDTRALAALARGILESPERWSRERGQGLAFMREHCFEFEHQQRVNHLASLV